MDDRALLEKAAGAFGVPAREEGGYLYASPGEISQTGWGIVTWCGLGTVQFWNPLESNDDAFRTAVKLDLHIQPDARHSTPHTRVERHGLQLVNLYEAHGADPYAATRRAIVRAAASLGDKQPCAGANCGTTTGQHSAECAAEHARASAPRVKG